MALYSKNKKKIKKYSTKDEKWPLSNYHSNLTILSDPILFSSNCLPSTDQHSTHISSALAKFGSVAWWDPFRIKAIGPYIVQLELSFSSMRWDVGFHSALNNLAEIIFAPY
jgi:hypothetical protein